MVDQGALDLGFQALDRATANGEDELVAFRKAIEAYEAARWRLIEEAPRDGSKILIWWPDGVGNFGPYWERAEILGWDEGGSPDIPPGGFWRSEIPGRSLTHEGLVHVAAKFRTIDPPTQDAVSRATSAPPAAEASS